MANKLRSLIKALSEVEKAVEKELENAEEEAEELGNDIETLNTAACYIRDAIDNLKSI